MAPGRARDDGPDRPGGDVARQNETEWRLLLAAAVVEFAVRRLG
ncbi:hypothetical protein ACWERV_20825 [Streptomyces sp. NPDC004031]